jgi:hypothetical protein
MGVSSILAGTFVGYGNDGNGIRRREPVGERDYSNEEKFVEPKYASVNELQAVSLISCFDLSSFYVCWRNDASIKSLIQKLCRSWVLRLWVLRGYSESSL